MLDNIIQANGIDWDQGHTAVLLGACGPEVSADMADLRQRVKKYADITPALESLARRRDETARAAEQNGENVTAREQFYIAAQYWATAQWTLDEADEQNLSLNQRKRDALGSYARHADHHVEYVWIPYQGKQLPAVFHLPPGYQSGRVPTIVSISGMDGYKERGVSLYGDRWMTRGYAVLAVDGPGYWESPLLGIYMSIPGWAETGRQVMKWLLARPEVDADRIGIVGSSFGSLLAAIILSAEPRYRAGAVAASFYEPRGQTLFQEASPTFKRRFMFMSGYTDEAQFDEFRKTVTWEGYAEKVEAPFLVLAGEDDELSPTIHTRRFINALKGPKQLVLYQGSRHALGGVASVNLWPPPGTLQANWMAARLENKPLKSEQWLVEGSGRVVRTPI